MNSRFTFDVCALGLPMLKFDIEIRKILSHGSTSFDWWNKISKYFDSWAIQSMSNWPFQKMKFFMSTEKIYNITEFDFRIKTITDSGSNNSNENINNVIMKVICWITSLQLWLIFMGKLYMISTTCIFMTYKWQLKYRCPRLPSHLKTKTMKILIGWQRSLMENLTFFIFEYQVWNPLIPTFKPKFKIWAHANVEICDRTKTIELVRKCSLLLRNHWKNMLFRAFLTITARFELVFWHLRKSKIKDLSLCKRENMWLKQSH